MNIQKFKVNNLPRPTDEMEQYIVAREYEGEWWFYGGWDDLTVALKVAQTVGGQTFNKEDIE